MPQIKLSQGFSDIKGKSNGSVFSENRQGKYFRNNKIGGGVRSPLWDKQKNIMHVCASHWRTLSINEQEAWIDYASTITVKNKVGDDVNLSGFNQFVSVNAQRLKRKLDIMPLPPSSYSPEDYSDAFFDFPDEYQIVPTHAHFLKGAKAKEGVSSFKLVLPTALNIDDDQSNLSFHLQLSNDVVKDIFEGRVVDLFRFTGPNDFVYNVSLEVFDVDKIIYKIEVEDDQGSIYSSSGFVHFVPETNLIIGNIYIGRPANNLGYSGMSFVETAFNNTGFDTMQAGQTVEEIEIFLSYGINSAPIKWTYLGITNGGYSDINSFLLAYGYAFNETIVQFLLNKIENDSFVILDVLGNKHFGNFVSCTPSDFDLKTVPVTLPPYVWFDTMEVNAGNQDILIYSSLPMSAGRRGATARWVQLGVINIYGLGRFPFWDLLLKKFSWTPPGGQYRFKFAYYDPNAGTHSTPLEVAQKKKVRFKAGSSLDGRVN